MKSNIDISELIVSKDTPSVDIRRILDICSTVIDNPDYFLQLQRDAEAEIAKRNSLRIKDKGSSIFTLQDFIDGDLTLDGTIMSYRGREVSKYGVIVDGHDYVTRQISNYLYDVIISAIKNGVLSDFFSKNKTLYNFSQRKTNWPLEMTQNGKERLGQELLKHSGIRDLCDYFYVEIEMILFRPKKEIYDFFKSPEASSPDLLNKNIKPIDLTNSLKLKPLFKGKVPSFYNGLL